MTLSHDKAPRSAVAIALIFLLTTGPASLAAGAPSSASRGSLPVVMGAAAAPAPATSSAAAPSAEDEAAGKRHFKRGDELFKQGRFLDAAHEFEAGFAVAPRPLFLLNIGHSYRKAQELRRARTAYEDFLRADPTTNYRSDVEDLIRSIDDALGASSLANLPTPPPSTPVTPPPPAVVTPPGPPVSALPPAGSSSATVPVRTGTIDLAPPVLIEVERSTGPAAQSESIFRSPWFWGAVGLVVAAGVGGTVYGLNRTPACTATRCLRETD